MQFNAKTICLSHNQVVPGSSPGGTTEKPLISTDIERFLFFKITTKFSFYTL